MGNPKQELWIAQHLEMTGCRVGLAVGALFDFIAEVVPRAPKWVRTIRAEWLFRLAIEPRRLWRRYLMGNVVFLIRVFAQPWVGVRLPRQ
jgi:exopolysaccharide biosynthesis WecB/TagA/CpsF family protein